MIGGSPQSAPPRPDLGWLRHRSAPAAAPSAPSAPSAPFESPASPPVAAPPAARSSLDLDASAPAAPGRPAATPGRVPRRVRSGQQTILTHKEPAVRLNRLQSGVGTLTIEAICSPVVGDVRIGAAYQLADGTSSIVQHASGIAAGPPGSKHALLSVYRHEYDGLTVDLRQSRALRRLVVYAFSESGRAITWGGTLVTTTFGGARIEIPLELGQHQGPAVLMSLYNVDGEYVLRAELELIAGEVREATRAFGYDRITWADSRTPVQ